MLAIKPKSLIKYAVSVSLLIILIGHMDVSDLIAKSGDMNVSYALLATALIVFQILFLNLRWHSYMNVGNHSVSFVTSGLINIAGYFANILFITSVGGIVAKSGLAVREGLSITRAVFATFLDRFMTLFALIVYSFLGLTFLGDVIDHTLLLLLFLTVTGVMLTVVLSAMILQSGALDSFILSSRKRSRMVVVLRDYTKNYGLMLKTGVYSLLAQASFVLAVYVLALAHNSHIDVIEFLALIPVLALIASLPISFGGWGVREGAFVYGLGLIGFSMESAFMLSVQVGLITFIAPLVIGPCYIVAPRMIAFWTKDKIVDL